MIKLKQLPESFDDFVDGGYYTIEAPFNGARYRDIVETKSAKITRSEAKAKDPEQVNPTLKDENTLPSTIQTAAGETIKKGEEYDTKGGGSWAFDEYFEKDDPLNDLKDKGSNVTLIMNRLMTRDPATGLPGRPFFIQGKAGWGKTAIIKNIARTLGLNVVTIYLDKMLPEDLSGVPVTRIKKVINTSKKTGFFSKWFSRKDDIKKLKAEAAEKVASGETQDKYNEDPNSVTAEEMIVLENAMPPWAQVMLERPKMDFLLFLDEMNQANPKVQSALMPIVLERTISGVVFKNMLIGAAGNYADENDMVSDLVGPLASRFGGIITWKESWDDALPFLRKKWQDKLPKETLDVLLRSGETNQIFQNPRQFEQFVLEFAYELKDSHDYYVKYGAAGQKDLKPTERYFERTKDMIVDFIEGSVSSSIDKDGDISYKKRLKEIVDSIYELQEDNGATEEDEADIDSFDFGELSDKVVESYCLQLVRREFVSTDVNKPSKKGVEYWLEPINNQVVYYLTPENWRKVMEVNPLQAETFVNYLKYCINNKQWVDPNEEIHTDAMNKLYAPFTAESPTKLSYRPWDAKLKIRKDSQEKVEWWNLWKNPSFFKFD